VRFLKLAAFTIAGGALNWPARWHDPAGSESPEELARHMVEMLCRVSSRASAQRFDGHWHPEERVVVAEHVGVSGSAARCPGGAKRAMDGPLLRHRRDRPQPLQHRLEGGAEKGLARRKSLAPATGRQARQPTVRKALDHGNALAQIPGSFRSGGRQCRQLTPFG
jgi:hypothetical protein